VSRTVVDSLLAWLAGGYGLALLVLIVRLALAASLRPVAINPALLARALREFGIVLVPVEVDGQVLDGVAAATTSDGTVLYDLYRRGHRLSVYENPTGRCLRRQRR
jgi:hypothetical protein